jgi:hypothetical protein
LDMGTSSPVGGVFATEKRQAMALGFPHPQPAAEKFPVNCVNYLTLGCRKIWEPYFAKLNVATQRRCKCA